MMNGIELIAAERAKHVGIGYDKEHDKQHYTGDLAKAAACYALGKTNVRIMEEKNHRYTLLKTIYPWDNGKDLEEKTRLRQLEIAGALIAAEIDRIVENSGDVEFPLT